jgi:hypothetical protein
MLQIFCNGYTLVFPGVLEVCCNYFYLDVAKVDLVLRHMLQCDPNAVMHTRGKQRDGKRRGMATVAQLVPACACSRARAVPSVTAYWLGESYMWNQIILQASCLVICSTDVVVLKYFTILIYHL